jgi:alkanesulfonate monooxygenase SsuD/methylene tetrahydromethanopterin reductase-like flavin-dependent oxidoreductase (luciferase family)
VLPDGRVVWDFSDTFLRLVNSDGSRPPRQPFINNSMIVQDGDALVQTLHRGTPYHWIVTRFGLDGIPLATTTILLAPVSAVTGTSKVVETIAVPVAIPIVLWSCVRA